MLRDFDRREKFFICGNIHEEFERYVQRPCKRAALSIGALLGNLDVVYLMERLREKANAYLGSFFFDPEGIKS